MSAHLHHPIRVYLLDDHEVVLRGMSIRLDQEADINVVGTAANSRELLAQLPTLQVDVLVLDFSLRHQDIDGLNLIRLLRIRYPRLRVLVLSANYTPDTVKLALRTGAHGYVSKGHEVDEVVRGIRALASGKRYLLKDMAVQVGALAAQTDVPYDGGIDPAIASKLTAREHEVVRCILEGMSTSEIAAKLSRSINTISTHKAAAFRKLGVKNNYELLSLHRGQTKI